MNPRASEVFAAIEGTVKREFDRNLRILSFDEYLALLTEKPELQTRGSAAYALDMLDHFGKVPVADLAPEPSFGGVSRFRVFDHPASASVQRVIGQEEVQTRLYQAIHGFVRVGVNNKLLLLHGPNGSAKTSIIHAIMGGLERYSQLPEGAAYQINWVFPHERAVKSSMGLATYSESKTGHTSYARLGEDDLAARIPCDLKDHPFLLVPIEHRAVFLGKLLGEEKGKSTYENLPDYLKRGDLCHRCRQIFDALHLANGGDLRKVLLHVQVERFYFSRRYRKGLVTIEPQLHVDAQYQQITMNRGVSTLPAALQHLNLFSLSGDLIDGNRGVIEFSDLLKRPIDSFKYLLIACETGAVNVGASIAYLDSILLGSTNELQLDAFKEFPDFTSFKARFELIRVPYLLSPAKETEVYGQLLDQLAGGKHIAPRTAWAVALWAVLTRLKKPNSINYPPNVSHLVSNLTPLEKAKLYESGETPQSLSPEDRKLLRSAVRKLREEYQNVPYYEGRMGASAREMKAVLLSAAQNPEFPCLSPLAALRALEDFVKRVSEYDFLKQDVKDGFHDSPEFINTVRNEYLQLIDQEVRDSMGLYSTTQWEDFLRRYVIHVSIALKKEKVKNPITGKLEDPDFTLIDEFEQIVGVTGDAGEKSAFRQNLISQVGAWSLDHPNQPVVYAKIFPEYWKRMEKHYYESQKSLLTKMHDALLVYGRDSSKPATATIEGGELAKKTVENLKSKHGYCELCAKEVITFLMRARY